MNSRAILYFLNLEIDLIKVTYAYKRPIWRHNGMPRAIANGGKLRVEFQTDQRIIRFFEEMTSDYFATYGKNSTMPKAKVVIYDANGYIIRTHKHLDVIIQRVKNIFIREGETPMMSYVVFTIGVQNYGTKHTEKWNISDSEPEPYKTPIVATESKTILVTEVTGSKELKLNEEGTYKVTSYNQTVSQQDKQHVKWMLKVDSKETQLDQQGEEIKYTPKNSKLPGNEITLMPYLKKHTETVSVKTKIVKEVVVFFIGGASDKETYYGNSATRIVEDEIKDEFDDIIEKEKLKKPYTPIYLGYNEVRGDEDVENKIISKIPSKDNTAIYIIGHSLGGWNGAHLSQILTDKGYNVDLLITLDPVGGGSTVTYISDIYWTTPKPKANYWININTSPEDYQTDDFIADFGGQWRPKIGMQINDECSCNHGRAGFMFRKSLKDTTISASDMLLHHIKLFLSKK